MTGLNKLRKFKEAEGTAAVLAQSFLNICHHNSLIRVYMDNHIVLLSASTPG